jgi:hypothetical protein
MADDGALQLNISLSDSDDGPDPASTRGDPAATAATNRKRDRDFQSEADFQKIKDSYRAKIENGEVRRRAT